MWFVAENLLVLNRFYQALKVFMSVCCQITTSYVAIYLNLLQIAINCDKALSYFTHPLFEFGRTDIAFCPAVQADFTQVTFFGKVS